MKNLMIANCIVSFLALVTVGFMAFKLVKEHRENKRKAETKRDEEVSIIMDILHFEVEMVQCN